MCTAHWWWWYSFSCPLRVEQISHRSGWRKRKKEYEKSHTFSSSSSSSCVGEMPAASQRAEKDERHTGNKSSDAAVVFSSFHQSAKLQQQPNKKKRKKKENSFLLSQTQKCRLVCLVYDEPSHFGRWHDRTMFYILKTNNKQSRKNDAWCVWYSSLSFLFCFFICFLLYTQTTHAGRIDGCVARLKMDTASGWERELKQQ